MRLDIFLVQNNYVKSRQKAKTLILEGNVKINGITINKVSFNLDESQDPLVEVIDSCPYVSRGALKLEEILNHTSCEIKNKVCIDIGASTGGFTQCLLLRGAGKVYAIDSGRNQLAQLIKDSKKVVSIEGYNARNICFEDIGEFVDIVTIDVSFISQTLILPKALNMIKDDGVLFSLIKPQFEVGKAYVGKGGIVKNKTAVLTAINNVIECANSCSFHCFALIKSPILGGDGNTEYISAFRKDCLDLSLEKIKKVVLNS